MGLLARLFGGKPKEDPARRAVLDRVRTLAQSRAFSGGDDLTALRECFPDPADFDLKLDAVNNLFELDRTEWAAALALEIAHDEKCPLTMLKGLVRHFVEAGHVERVLEPLEWLVDERPSETEMALELGRHLLRAGEHARCLEDLAPAMNSATESRHLFALAGECHLRLKQWEDAVIHLRTACELYERAFRLHQVLPDDMTNEQFEYTRLYGMLEDAAREHLGPEKMAEAFETITMEPSSFGLMKEAEQLAATRIEYKPASTALLSVGDLAAQCRAMDGDAEKEPLCKYYEGMRALREQQYVDAMARFREAVELDLEAFGAYFGWAACENLQRGEPLPEVAALPPAEMEALEKVVPDWHAMTAAERRIALAALGPIAGFLPAMAKEGATMTVHPLDVRLRDLYADRVEMRFGAEDRGPQAQSAFAAKKRAHVRLDEFLHVRPEHFTFARMAGYLVADVVEARGGKTAQSARETMGRAKGALMSGARVTGSIEEFFATGVELLACVRLFGEAAHSEYAEAFEKAGMFRFLEDLK